ncbi:MAG TPA: c-type cytochrome [Candidatus Acidoferrum sp.]|jgi:photosynthetic reaction center cytochrome c subunit|nr:c-type cytochrome [Candidatus Acidoferrum sp.]
MRPHARLLLCLGAISMAVVLTCAAERLEAQAEATKSRTEEPQTAEQKFKNIQVLKGIPADQLIPSMQFISASLGVECEFCHVQRAMDKDDKKPKLTARKMMTMMMQIDADSFKNEREVTCYTCHRGSIHPVGIPILSADNPTTPRAPEEEAAAATALPSAQAILDKYLAAVGGAAALQKIKTRVQTGSIEVADNKYPIDIYSQAPDKRVSISHLPSGPSVTAFNGEAGWLSTPNGIRRMSSGEQQAARIDAELYFPLQLPQMYQEFEVGPGEVIDGNATYLVSAKGKYTPDLRLYFEQESGLLVRLIRLAETPLGRNPTEIDYADFRVADGVKLSYRWTLARPNGRFIIQIDAVKQNVPLDEGQFVTPGVQEQH